VNSAAPVFLSRFICPIPRSKNGRHHRHRLRRLTAAITLVRQPESLVLEGPLPGGQLTTTSEGRKLPGFPEGSTVSN